MEQQRSKTRKASFKKSNAARFRVDCGRSRCRWAVEKKLEGVFSILPFRLPFALCQCFQGETNKQTNKPVDPPRTCLQTAPRVCGSRVKAAATASGELIHLDSCVAEGGRGMGSVFGLLAVDGAVCVCVRQELRGQVEVSLNMHNCKQETLCGGFKCVWENLLRFVGSLSSSNLLFAPLFDCCHFIIRTKCSLIGVLINLSFQQRLVCVVQWFVA